MIEPAGFSHDRGIARLGSVEAAGAGAQSRAFRVGTRTLDGLSAERDIGLLKIDVEGGEYDVLRGAASRLQRRAIRDIVFEDFAPPSSSAAIALLSQPWVLGMGHRAIVPQADPGSEGEQRGATRLGITQLHRDDPARSRQAADQKARVALPSGWLALRECRPLLSSRLRSDPEAEWRKQYSGKREAPRLNLQYWIRHPLEVGRRLRYLCHDKLHPTEPFLAPAAVRFLDANLPREGIGLEWGSGRSTRWFAARLSRLVAVEHDESWAHQVRSQLEQAGLKNVDYHLIALEHPKEQPTRPDYAPMPRYVSVVNEFPDEYFDFIEVDGHYRQACVAQGRQKVKKGGLLLIDDSNWIPMDAWGVPAAWPLVHQSTKINTTTSIWKRVD